MHCFGCALNLLKNVRFLKGSMDTIYEISNFIKICPKRDGMLQKTQKDKSLECSRFRYPQFRVLCPKRWTVRAESMKRPEIMSHFIGHNQVKYATVDICCYVS